MARASTARSLRPRGLTIVPPPLHSTEDNDVPPVPLFTGHLGSYRLPSRTTFIAEERPARTATPLAGVGGDAPRRDAGSWPIFGLALLVALAVLSNETALLAIGSGIAAGILLFLAFLPLGAPRAAGRLPLQGSPVPSEGSVIIPRGPDGAKDTVVVVQVQRRSSNRPGMI